MSNFLELMEAVYAPPPVPPTRKRRQPTAKTIRRQLEAIGIDGLQNVTRHADGSYTASFDMPHMDWQKRSHYGRVLAKQRAAEIEYLFDYTIVEHGIDFKRADNLRFNGQTTPMVTFKLDKLARSLTFGGYLTTPQRSNIIEFPTQRADLFLGAWHTTGTPNAMSALTA